jgi:hypothetical protein
MKPKHDEVRRMLLLALVCWKDFLNTLNSPLFSFSHLQDDIFLTQICLEFSDRPEIREALILIDVYWNRTPEISLALGMTGFSFSKPHTVFQTTLIRSTDKAECERLVTGVTRPIDEIENPIVFSGKVLPEINFNLEDEVRMAELVSKYDREMLGLLCTPDPYIRAGIELSLITRGFTV